MKKDRIIFWCILFISISCVRKVQTIDSGSISTLNIDVNEIGTHQVNKLSDILEPIDVIALETTNESLIRNINKIEFYKDDIYVLDLEGSKSLLVFSKNGKYKYKIGRIGNGPGEYSEPRDFDIDEEEVRILTHNKLLIYTSFGINFRTFIFKRLEF